MMRAVLFVKARPHKLSPRAARATPPTVRQGEQSPWRAARQYEEQVVSEVSDRMLKLFLVIRRQWLHLRTEFHKAAGDELFKLNGRIFISPKTGRPLTKRQWDEVVRSLDSAVQKLFKDQADVLVKRALLLGKVLQGMAFDSRVDEDLANIEPERKIPEGANWEAAYAFGQQHAAELIVDLQASARKNIATAIIDAIKNRRTTRQLEVVLFDEFADLNRDWRRIAETEISTNLSAGLLMAEGDDREEGETVYMIGISGPGACKDCLAHLDKKVVVLSDEPVASGRVTVKGEEYETIWVGKDNVGRRAGTYWATIPLHPHCRCSWTRYYPEMKELLGLGKAMSHKYVKREGAPGHYVYTYAGEGGQGAPRSKTIVDALGRQWYWDEEKKQYRNTATSASPTVKFVSPVGKFDPREGLPPYTQRKKKIKKDDWKPKPENPMHDYNAAIVREGEDKGRYRDPFTEEWFAGAISAKTLGVSRRRFLEEETTGVFHDDYMRHGLEYGVIPKKHRTFIRQYLDRDLPASLPEVREALDFAVSVSPPISGAVEAWRGMVVDAPTLAAFKEGEVIQLHHPLSLTEDEKFARTFASSGESNVRVSRGYKHLSPEKMKGSPLLLQVYIPEGTRVGRFGADASFKEMFLSSGGGFRVHKVGKEEGEYGATRVVLELVPNLKKSSGESVVELIDGEGADRPDEDFDYEELVIGTFVEHEHTSNNEAAKRIAKTHLAERRDYYHNELFAEEREGALARMAEEWGC